MSSGDRAGVGDITDCSDPLRFGNPMDSGYITNCGDPMCCRGPSGCGGDLINCVDPMGCGDNWASGDPAGCGVKAAAGQRPDGVPGLEPLSPRFGAPASHRQPASLGADRPSGARRVGDKPLMQTTRSESERSPPLSVGLESRASALVQLARALARADGVGSAGGRPGPRGAAT